MIFAAAGLNQAPAARVAAEVASEAWSRDELRTMGKVPRAIFGIGRPAHVLKIQASIRGSRLDLATGQLGIPAPSLDFYQMDNAAPREITSPALALCARRQLSRTAKRRQSVTSGALQLLKGITRP